MNKQSLIKRKLRPLADAMSLFLFQSEYSHTDPLIRTVNDTVYIKFNFIKSYAPLDDISRHLKENEFTILVDNVSKCLNCGIAHFNQHSSYRFIFNLDHMMENYDETFDNFSNYLESKRGIKKYNL